MTPNVLPRDHTREDYDYQYDNGVMAPIRIRSLDYTSVWCNRHGWEREIIPASWITKEVSYSHPWIYRWTCPTCGESRSTKNYILRHHNPEQLALKAVWAHINAKHDGIVPHRKIKWDSDGNEDPRLFYK